MPVLLLARKYPVWVTVGALVVVVLASWGWSPWEADAAEPAEAAFVGVEPTRCVDTRSVERVGPHGGFGPDEVKTIQLGGVPECGVPDGAVAVLFNLSGIGATETTYFTAYPTGGEKSTTSVLNTMGVPRVVGNAVTVALSEQGAMELYNFAGNVDVTIDVLGFYVPTTEGIVAGGDVVLSTEIGSLQAAVSAQAELTSEQTESVADLSSLVADQADQIDQLMGLVDDQSDQIDELETLLAGVSRETVDGHSTLLLTGMNLQLVNGTDVTDGNANGLGNLVVGYNEDVGEDDDRSGSHNIVVGPDHTYSSTSGAVFGVDNAIGSDSTWASITGGTGNTIEPTAPGASISGGIGNTISSDASNASITGGQQNTISPESDAATITGGINNTVATFSRFAVVVGGSDNTTGGFRNVIVGGTNNLTTGGEQDMVVVGGESNTASGSASVSVGGNFTRVLTEHDVMLGGDGTLGTPFDCDNVLNDVICGEGTIAAAD